MSKLIFGIDVGGTTVKCGLFDYNGELLESFEIPTRTEDHGKNILPDIAQAIRNKLAEKEASVADLLGVGIGVPGPVVRESFVPRCVNLGWGGTDVASDLSSLLDGTRVVVANDANAAAMGEYIKGGGKGYNSMMLFTLGTGVGGGIILDGKPLAGAHGTGGEIGHITVNPQETVKCVCGRRGCMEQYASATGLIRVTRLLLEEEDTPSLLRGEDVKLSARTIFDAAEQGDEIADRAIDRMCDALAQAMGTIASTIDPEAFCIGGGVARAGEILIDRIKKHYPKYTFGDPNAIEFVFAKLGNDAGMVGAANLILRDS